MKFGRQVIALGGIVILGGYLLPVDSAHAYGQQWRPEPGFVPVAQVRPYHPVANLPSFRPRDASPVAYQPRRWDHHEQRPYVPQVPAWTGQAGNPYAGYQPWAGQGSYAYAGYQPVGYYYAPPPMGGYAAPVWSQPFNGMTQMWQQQMPLFARQFAWRPADQPWRTGVAPVAQAQRYPTQSAPQMVGFRPAQPGYAPALGSWRPAPVYAASYPGYRAPSYALGGARDLLPSRVPSRPVATVSLAEPRYAAATRGHWRPDLAAAVPWRNGNAFRPAAYGRSVASRTEVPARQPENFGFTQDQLPGWVTTYQESQFSGSCSWCSGS